MMITWVEVTSGNIEKQLDSGYILAIEPTFDLLMDWIWKVKEQNQKEILGFWTMGAC
jgi:hypothetical protein